MNKLAAICGLIGLFVFSAWAPLMAQDQPPQQTPDQSQAPGGETEPATPKRMYITPKYEFSGGYAYRGYYAATGTFYMNGWYASADYNLFRWLGIAGEVADTSKNQGIIFGVPYGDTRIATFVAGPRIYPLAHHKLTPFGQLLFGAGYYRNTKPMFGTSPGKTISSTVHAWQIGGGVDYYFSRHVGARLVQLDIGSTNYFPNSSAFVNRTMRRVSFGVVLRFGQK